jgi:hypothetical protein
MIVPLEVLRVLLLLKISNTSRERSMRQEAMVQSFGGFVVLRISSFWLWALATSGTMVRRSGYFTAQIEAQSQQRSSLKQWEDWQIRLLHDAAPHRHARATMKMGHWPGDSHISLVMWPSVFWVSLAGSIRANHFITNVWSLSEYLSRSSKASPSIKSLT